MKCIFLFKKHNLVYHVYSIAIALRNETHIQGWEIICTLTIYSFPLMKRTIILFHLQPAQHFFLYHQYHPLVNMEKNAIIIVLHYHNPILSRYFKFSNNQLYSVFSRIKFQFCRQNGWIDFLNARKINEKCFQIWAWNYLFY